MRDSRKVVRLIRCKELKSLPAYAACIALGVARSAFAAEPIHLKMGLTPGQTVRYGFQEVELIVNRSEKIKEGVMPSQFQTEAQAQFRAVEATAEGLTVEMTYQRVRFQADSRILQEPPSFDTAAPAEEARENPLAPALLAIINKPIMLRLAASGKIERVEPPTLDIPDVKFAGVAERMLTPEWITSRFQPVFSLAAPGPDVPAGMWSVTSEMPTAQGSEHFLRVHTMHVVRAVNQNIVTIDLAGKAELLPATAAHDAKTKLVAFSGTGKAIWNTASGLLGERTIKYDWQLDLLPQPDLPAQADVSVQFLLMALK